MQRHLLPVGLHHPQHVATEDSTVLERLGEHVRAAVGADHVEARFEQPHRVVTRTGGDIEHLADAPGLQLVDEERALAPRAALPVDELIPLLHEASDVLLDVVIGFPHLGRAVAEVLPAVGFRDDQLRCVVTQHNRGTDWGGLCHLVTSRARRPLTPCRSAQCTQPRRSSLPVRARSFDVESANGIA